MENQKAIVTVVILFVLIIAGMFAFSYMQRAGEDTTQQPPEEETMEEEEEAVRINAKHFYRDGVHTLAGEILMPTPCDLLEADATVVAPDPGIAGPKESHAVIEFSVINTAEACAQVVTPQRFKVSFEGPSDIPMEAFFKGEPAILNLIEAGEDEDPDDFELFIKG